MINEVKEEIIEYCNNNKYLIDKINILIAYLIHLKYLCDINTYSYDEVIQNDELYELNRDITRIKRAISDSRFHLNKIFPLNRILIKLKNIDTKELLLEFLDSIDKPLYLHSDSDKIAIINADYNPFTFYNPKGNTTYIMNISYYFETLKVFDNILGINNTYIDNNNIKDNNYDYIYIYDDTLRFSKYKENILDDIKPLLKNNKVVLIANYNKISNFREGRSLVRYIKTIILDNNKAIIEFINPKEDNEISIINTDLVKDRNKLLSIIKNNRKQKNILIKITTQDIRDNNYRIGFNLYRLEKTSKIKDINNIVDENTKYLERLNSINLTVEKEINKLLNR